MNEAKVKLTLEDKQILGELSKVGKGFDTLSGKVKGVEKNSQDMGKALTNFGAKFITFELAKKMGTFVANTARGAKEMQGLSAETKKNAEQFTSILDDTARVGQNIALWAMNLGGASGAMGGIAKLVRETADGWAFMMGGQTSDMKAIQGSLDMNAITAQVRLLSSAKISLANAEKNLGSARGGEFYDVELNNLAKVQSKFDELTKGMSETQISALLAGKSIDKVLDPKSMSRFSDSLKQSGTTKTTATNATPSKPKEVDFEAIKSARLDMLADLQDKSNELYQADKDAEKRALDEKVANEKKALDEIEAQRQKAFDAEVERRQAQLTAFNTLANGIESALQAGDMKDKKRRLAWKATAIAEAIANTAVGITKAYAQGGVLGFATGAGIALAGGAQIAVIKDQKFARGGIVQGAETGDQVPVRANGGEMVLTKQQQANLFSMANSGGMGGSITYSPTYNVETSSATMRRNYREFAREVKAVLSNPSFGRTQGALI